MSVANEATIGERIESMPKTIMFFLFGASILAFGFALDMIGMGRSAGLAGALAVILMGLAVLIHLVYLVLGTRS